MRALLDLDTPPIRALLRIGWAIRKAIKWLARPLRINDQLIECCEVCGIQQPLIWHAPHALWEQVTGLRRPGGDYGEQWAPGIYCPRCFDQRAESLGLLLTGVPLPHGTDEPILDTFAAAVANPVPRAATRWQRFHTWCDEQLAYVRDGWRAIVEAIDP